MKLSEKKLNIKSILIITVILPVFVIAVSGVAIYITAKSVQPGSTLDVSLLEEKEEKLPETNEEALTVLEGYTESAITSGKLKFSGKTAVSIDEITCDKTEVGEILSFAASSISGKMQEKYEEKAIEYGEDASELRGILPGSVPADFSAEITDGILSLTLEFDSVFSNMYFINDDKTAVRLFIKENESVFSAVNEKFVPVCVKYIMTADELNEEIISLSVVRTYSYNANISFVNTLMPVGSTPFGMTLTFTEDYGFSFAGIEIEENEITFSEGDYDTLTVIPYVEENLGEDEYSLEFTSSDDTVVSVDENGQITALKEHGEPVKITVKLQYLGKTFTDSCAVFVVTPVETVRISDTELSMKKGDTHTLEASVTPDNATIKRVDFVSSDKSVVAVSSSGEITAVGAGTAVVYAYSVQGYVATECTVSVTE